jgi:hypothetical protein
LVLEILFIGARVFATKRLENRYFLFEKLPIIAISSLFVVKTISPAKKISEPKSFKMIQTIHC